jgi:hypothetical protein
MFTVSPVVDKQLAHGQIVPGGGHVQGRNVVRRLTLVGIMEAGVKQTLGRVQCRHCLAAGQQMQEIGLFGENHWQVFGICGVGVSERTKAKCLYSLK